MAHSHTQTGAVKGRYIGLSVVLTLAFVVGETVAGYFAHSLALLSDAGHNFADALALLLSWYAIWVGTKPSDVKRTYGYHRVGILVALVNAVSLVVIALVIFWEAVQRFRLPEPVHSGLMIWVALAAVALNAAITFWLHGEAKEDLNVRSAYLHMLGDAVSALGVVLAGIVVAFTGTQNRSNSSVSGGQAGEVGRAGVLTVGFQAGGERLALEAASHPRMGFRRSLVQIQSPRVDFSHQPFDYEVEGLFCFNSRRFPSRSAEFNHKAISPGSFPASAVSLCHSVAFSGSNERERWARNAIAFNNRLARRATLRTTAPQIIASRPLRCGLPTSHWHSLHNVSPVFVMRGIWRRLQRTSP